MKKIVFYILLFSGSLILSCSEDSGSGNPGDYINPGFVLKSLNTKSWTNIGIADDSGTDCQAIFYSGKVNNIRYVGIAVKSGTYNLKIYWPGSETEFSSKEISGCTVKEGATTVSNTPITMEIINNDDTTYTINFDSAVAGTSINANSSITAQSY